MRRLIALLTLLLASLAAHAHKPSDAYLQLAVDGAQITVRFDIALRDLERDLGLDADDDGRLQWREVRGRWGDIDRVAQAGLALQADGRRCEAGPVDAPQLDEHSDGHYAVLNRHYTCPASVRTLSLGYTLFAQSDPTHRGIVRMAHGDVAETAVLTPGAAAHTFVLGDPHATPNLGGFIAEGVHHILIGTDHVLFLLALLLPAVLMRTKSGWQPAPRLAPVLLDVLRVVTAFTVAHSITLALAAFDVVNPPSRWVESTIAASVALAALNNLVPIIREGRWKLTFVFGLVHGFGFAGALKDLGLARSALALPLFGFNLGVELGQMAIVVVFVTLVWKLRETRFYRKGLLRVGSVAIAVLALTWLVERVFDVKVLPF